MLLLFTGCIRTVYIPKVVDLSAPEYSYTVLRVIDGDTVVLDFDDNEQETKNEHVRLFGYDAPETRTKDQDEKKRGLAAKRFLEEIILGKKIVFELHGAGFYGRLLGVILLENDNVNEMMQDYCNGCKGRPQLQHSVEIARERGCVVSREKEKP